MYDVHHRKWLWEDWDYFEKASPIYYATRNRTPTLILHGKDDPRVNPGQSLELYRHLKGSGRRCAFVSTRARGTARPIRGRGWTTRSYAWLDGAY